MATFDQKNQNVTYQYNAAGDINFKNVSNRAELTSVIERLQAELDEAVRAKAIDGPQAAHAKALLGKAVAESKEAKPNKASIVNYINGAKHVVEGITATGGLVNALVSAAALAVALF